MRVMKSKVASHFATPENPINLTPKRCSTTLQDANRRILIMRTGAFGDILMGTPLIATLRNSYPDGWICWIVAHTERQALDANPYLDEILVWNGDDFSRARNIKTWLINFATLKSLRQELKLRKFDTFISYQAEEWPKLTKMIDAPMKIGFFDYFSFKKIKPSTLRKTKALFRFKVTKHEHPCHRTEQYFSVIKYLGLNEPLEKRMSIGFTQDDLDVARLVLQQNGIDFNESFIAIIPVTTWITKNWQTDRFAQVADQISLQFGCKVVLLGSQKDQEGINAVAHSMQIKPFAAAGLFTFRQMSALISECVLLISGDSGPMHVAGAVDTPFVSIFGSTAPEKYRPKDAIGIVVRNDVPCSPCESYDCKNLSSPLRCLTSIPVEAVYDAVSFLYTDVMAKRNSHKSMSV